MMDLTGEINLYLLLIRRFFVEGVGICRSIVFELMHASKHLNLAPSHAYPILNSYRHVPTTAGNATAAASSGRPAPVAPSAASAPPCIHALAALPLPMPPQHAGFHTQPGTKEGTHPPAVATEAAAVPMPLEGGCVVVGGGGGDDDGEGEEQKQEQGLDLELDDDETEAVLRAAMGITGDEIAVPVFDGEELMEAAFKDDSEF